jgi:hypothetical protein
MQQNPFWEADSCLVEQNIHHFLWAENFIVFLSQLNPIHIIVFLR